MPQAPPVPVNLRIFSRSDVSLLIAWDSSLCVTGHQIQISWPGQTQLVFDAKNPQPIQDLIRLVPNRFYTIRVRDICNDLTSDFSEALYAATQPPRPSPIFGRNSMIDQTVTLSWQVHLPPSIDIANQLFVEIRRDQSRAVFATDLPLSGIIQDKPPLGFNSYSIRLFSIMTNPESTQVNQSEWSEAMRLNKHVFAMLRLPGAMENQRLRYNLSRQPKKFN